MHLFILQGPRVADPQVLFHSKQVWVDVLDGHYLQITADGQFPMLS